MIEGTVDDDGVPLILLSFGNLTQALIVDTGFNGDLELPEFCRSQLNPRFLGSYPSVLAAGVSIEEDVYTVNLLFDERQVQAEVTFSTESVGLVGTHLLREHRLDIDFVNRTLLLTRVNQPQAEP